MRFTVVVDKAPGDLLRSDRAGASGVLFGRRHLGEAFQEVREAIPVVA